MGAIYLEDIAVGQQGLTSRRTITETDIVNFCGLSGDYNPLHCDEVFVREESQFRGRIAHGMLVFSISTGLRSQFDDWQMVAFLQADRRFLGPTYPGDTIQNRWTVSEVKRSRSNPERGIVKVSVEVVNQDGEVVQAGTDVIMVAARTRGEDA